MECAALETVLEKLAVDFAAGLSRHGFMTSDDMELIRRILTQAGMRMEDASATAILLDPREAGKPAVEITRLRAAVQAVLALIDAAVVLAAR